MKRPLALAAIAGITLPVRTWAAAAAITRTSLAMRLARVDTITALVTPVVAERVRAGRARHAHDWDAIVAEEQRVVEPAPISLREALGE